MGSINTFWSYMRNLGRGDLLNYTFWNTVTFTWQRNKRTDGLDNIFQVQQNQNLYRIHNFFDKKYVDSEKPPPIIFPSRKKKKCFKSTLHAILLKRFKPNYFKKKSSLSSFLLTYGHNTSSKWQWSTQQGSFMSQMHGNSLLKTPGQIGLYYYHR